MMKSDLSLSDAYSWEAELADGTTIKDGGDLAGCVRFSLIPAEGTGLPRHDIIGVEMLHRFGRGFVRALGGGVREYLHCVVCRGFRVYVRSTDGTALIGPEDYELYL